VVRVEVVAPPHGVELPEGRRRRLLHVADAVGSTVCVLDEVDDGHARWEPMVAPIAPTHACVRAAPAVDAAWLVADAEPGDDGAVSRFAIGAAGARSLVHALLADGTFVRGRARVPAPEALDRWPPTWSDGRHVLLAPFDPIRRLPHPGLGRREPLESVTAPDLVAIFESHPSATLVRVNELPSLAGLYEDDAGGMGAERFARAVVARLPSGWAIGPVDGDPIFAADRTTEAGSRFEIVTQDGATAGTSAGEYVYTWRILDVVGSALVPRARARVAWHVFDRPEHSDRWWFRFDGAGNGCVRFELGGTFLETRTDWDHPETWGSPSSVTLRRDGDVAPQLDLAGTWSYADGPLVRAECAD
jgi:hypothetical protein